MVAPVPLEIKEVLLKQFDALGQLNIYFWERLQPYSTNGLQYILQILKLLLCEDAAKLKVEANGNIKKIFGK